MVHAWTRFAFVGALASTLVSCGFGDDDEDAKREACPAGTAIGTKHDNVLGLIDLGSHRVCLPCTAGTYCAGGIERSAPCLFGTWDHDRDPRTQCRDKAPCYAGRRVVEEGDAVTDRVCADCAPGTFTAERNRPVCEPAVAQPCEPGFMPRPLSTSEQPSCEWCQPGAVCPGGFSPPIPCPPGTWDDDSDTTTECIPWSLCQPGQYVETMEGDATSDRGCRACGDDGYSTALMAPACTARTSCPPGTYASTPLADRDRTCTVCPLGSTSTSSNATTCGAVRQIASGADQSCAVMTDGGTVRCWGAAVDAADARIERRAPVAIPNVAAALSVAAGEDFACVRTGSEVLCWGSNAFGRLGTAEPGPPSLEPTLVVQASGLQLLATRTEGFVRGDWGLTRWGGIGDPTTLGGSGTFPPYYVSSLRGVFDFAAFGGDYCGVDHGTAVRCMGRDRVVTTTPVPGARQVVVGQDRMCARDVNGAVSCFGRSPNGQLGGNVTPTTFPGFTAVTAVASGRGHVCALENGEVFCFGANDAGQLGDGTLTDRSLPTWVPGLADVVAITAGYRHTCALVADGTVSCWGANDWGQLGDGTTTNRSSPTPVTGL